MKILKYKNFIIKEIIKHKDASALQILSSKVDLSDIVFRISINKYGIYIDLRQSESVPTVMNGSIQSNNGAKKRLKVLYWPCKEYIHFPFIIDIDKIDAGCNVQNFFKEIDDVISARTESSYELECKEYILETPYIYVATSDILEEGRKINKGVNILYKPKPKSKLKYIIDKGDFADKLKISCPDFYIHQRTVGGYDFMYIRNLQDSPDLNALNIIRKIHKINTDGNISAFKAQDLLFNVPLSGDIKQKIYTF